MKWIAGLLVFAWVPSAAAQDCTELPDALAYANRGNTAYEQRLYEDAVLDFTCAIQLAPDTPDYYNERGNAYYWLDQDKEANADYTKVLELDPEAGYAYNNLANLYSSIGDYEKALEYYTQALSLPNGTDEIVYTNRASLYIESGNYEKAQSDLDEALGIDPNHPEAHLSQASLYVILNEVQEAASSYETWVTLTETDSSGPAYVPNRNYATRLETGQVERIQVSVKSGDVLSLSAAAIDSDQKVDPLLVILDESGTALIADDDSGVNIDAVIADFVIPSTGTYTVVLSNSGGFYKQGIDGKVNISIELKTGDGTLIEVAAPTPAVNAEAVATLEETDIVVSFSTFRLFAGVKAEVFTTEGDRLNLRGGPGLRFDILTKLDKGGLVTLIEGPRKEDGLAWWRIRTEDGTEGWAVERVETEQTLQMALIIGEDAIVTGGDDALNVRVAAGRSNDLAFQLNDGERLTLLEAPQLVDGFQWWHIRTTDGREGWTIDRLEGERVLIPAKEREAQQ